ncbi:MAG: GntR family transcriptional regulator [Acidobacteriota bacterium]|nr:GntR family transcriptional regulator [Acidobacteriota bacterium]MDW3228763.1 GntR family transcriptional regulator [Acidobacteriota bacterium]MDY0232056.1 GntR family transcriptional regulator [Candidatus Saccharicenans sp.]
MNEKPVLNVKSLKEQVYDFLREQMRRGEILPGSVIDLEETSQKLGVSRTPLRDALLQLESEEFVTILPRRKVVVNVLEDKDIKNYYEIIGALESVAILKAFEVLSNREIDYMEKMNQEMSEAIKADNFDLYYEKNLNFHNVYLNACGNEKLMSIVNNLKKRLYDFPRPKGFVKEWEEASIGEHARLIDYLRHGQKEEAAKFIRDIHWSYEVQKKYIVKYYQHLTEPA